MQLSKTISIIFILLIFLGSFSNSPKEKPVINGLWQCDGYGKVLEIQKSKVKTYDYNNVSCTPYTHLQSLKYVKKLNQIDFIHPDTMTFTIGSNRYKYFRIKKLPKTCNGESFNKSRILNYNSFMDSFETFYSFSKERNIDWNKIKRQYQPQIKESMTDLQLLLVFENIIKEIDDKHTKMGWVPTALKNDYNNYIGQQTNYDSIWVKAQNKTANRILNQVNNFNLNTAIWGVTSEKIGYMQINDMLCYSKFNISNTLVDDKSLPSFKSKWGKTPDLQTKHQKNLHKLMTTIIKQFKNTKGIIIDLRFNEGGYSFNTLDILSFFADSTIEVCSRSAKNETGFTKPHKVAIKGQKITFDKKIVILTSRATVSGGELFILGTLDLPQITRIGNNTSGNLSTSNTKLLPIGWYFKMSSQVCFDPKGKNHEVKGIPPHIISDSTKNSISFYKSIIQTQDDLTVEKAIKLLKKKVN